MASVNNVLLDAEESIDETNAETVGADILLSNLVSGSGTKATMTGPIRTTLRNARAHYYEACRLLQEAEAAKAALSPEVREANAAKLKELCEKVDQLAARKARSLEELEEAEAAWSNARQC